MASMSPWRDVPRPRYTPSLYDVFATDFAAGAATGAAAGAGAAVDTGVGAVSVGAAVETGADGIGALGVAACVTTADGTTAGGTIAGDAETGVVAVGGSAAWIVVTCAETDGDTSDVFTTAGVTAGVDAAMDDGAAIAVNPPAAPRLTAGVNAASGVATGDIAGSSTTDDAERAGTVIAPDSPTPVRAPAAPVPARDALRGRRTALSAAIRSAAGLVLAKPAA